MKPVLLIVVASILVTGCVNSDRYHRQYSSYPTVTPVYPRYEQHYYQPSRPQVIERYVVPIPTPPRFRDYERESKSHHRREHHDDDHDEHDNHRSHQR
jgi:hypothetical protein